MAHIHHVMEVEQAAWPAEKKKSRSELIEEGPARATPPAEDSQPVPPEAEPVMVNTSHSTPELSAQTKVAPSEVVEAEPVSDATPDSPVAIPHAVDKTVPPPKAKPSPVGGSLKSLSSLEKAFILRQQEQEEVELDLDQIRVVWEEYAEKADSPSLRQFLLDAQIKLKGERITVVVGTQMARGMIQQDTDLMPFIREQVRYPNLGMVLEVDTSLAPERDTSDDAPTTPREIFDHLGEKNPMLYELRKRFDLRIDPV
jgi:hypothetical protein